MCQGESIADSPADVASDMRRLVRERIEAGDSEATITENLARSYGDGILMRPPLKTATFLLWFGPLIVLGFAALLAWRYFKRSA